MTIQTTTTIRLHKQTAELLQLIKNKLGHKNIDETIRTLITHHEEHP